MATERIIGIDFGTSTSVIRVKRYKDGEPIGEVLETKEVVFGGHGATVPTLIMKKDDDESVSYYGYEAQQTKRRFTTYHSFKVDLESSKVEKRAQARKLTEEFFAFMGKQYRDQSDGGYLGNADDKERTIISYPVKWSEETKCFMLEAARKAGFPNVTGMDEAEAAIQAVTVMSEDHLRKNGLFVNGKPSNILLIDMGAGTTDLVLCRYTPGEDSKEEILSTWPKSGKILFGGREIDVLLKNFFWDKMDEADAEVVFKKIGTDKFKSWKELTVSPVLRNNDTVSDFEALDSCLETLKIEMDEYCLDRTAFEKCLKKYLTQLPELINGCIQEAKTQASDVDLVIITGGHSQWYFVREMLKGEMPQFGEMNLTKIKENPNRIIPISRPQETVALGLVYSPISVSISSDDDEEKRKLQEEEERRCREEAERLAWMLEEKRKAEEAKKQKEERSQKGPASLAGPNDLFTKRMLESAKAIMPIDGIFYISGRGLVVNGCLIHGQIRAGDSIRILGEPHQVRSATVEAIVMDRKLIKCAQKGDSIGLLLSRDVGKNDVKKGHIIIDSLSGTPTNGKQDAQKQSVNEHREYASNETTSKTTTVMQGNQYAPESEFELLSDGEGYVIVKYTGDRNVVAIPPYIRGRKVLRIGRNAFTRFKGFFDKDVSTIEKVSIPGTVTVIDEGAFYRCTKLHTVIAHSGIISIGKNAFGLCINLNVLYFGIGKQEPGFVTFPPELKVIGDSAIQSCLGIKEVMISKKTKWKGIGWSAIDQKHCAIFFYGKTY